MYRVCRNMSFSSIVSLCLNDEVTGSYSKEIHSLQNSLISLGEFREFMYSTELYQFGSCRVTLTSRLVIASTVLKNIDSRHYSPR